MDFIEQSQKNMKNKTDVLDTTVSINFIEQSKKNTKKYNSYSKEIKKIIPLLKEVTAAAGVGGFVGRKGMGIDALFAGPFHPKFSELEKLLKQQLKDRKKLKIQIVSNLIQLVVGIKLIQNLLNWHMKNYLLVLKQLNNLI